MSVNRQKKTLKIINLDKSQEVRNKPKIVKKNSRNKQIILNFGITKKTSTNNQEGSEIVKKKINNPSEKVTTEESIVFKNIDKKGNNRNIRSKKFSLFSKNNDDKEESVSNNEILVTDEIESD